MKAFGYVYKITNILNGKVYIGQTTKTIEHRWKQHCGMLKYRFSGSPRLKNAMLCHGVGNFEIEEIATADNYDELNALEVKYIQEFDSMNTGYNLTEGGKNGKCSDETRRKHSAASKKRDCSHLHTPEIVKKMSESLKGHPYSGPRERIMQKSKWCWVNEVLYQTPSIAARFEGMPLSTLYAVLNGTKRSNQFTAYFAEKECYKAPPEVKAQPLPPNTIPVTLNGIEYASQTEAARKTGLSRNKIKKMATAAIT